MATTNNTTRSATPAEKTATAKVEQVSLDMLVKAYRSAGADAAVKSDLMLSIKEQRDSLRVLQARAAVRVFRHPEVGERYATAAKVTGEARTTLRRYIDAGVAFGKSADSTGEPTARELKIIKDAFDTVAEKQAERDKAAREKNNANAEKVSKLGQSKDGVVEQTEDTTTTEAPTFKDIMRQTKALSTAIQAVKLANGGKLSADELKALKSTLTVILNDAAKATTVAK